MLSSRQIASTTALALAVGVTATVVARRSTPQPVTADAPASADATKRIVSAADALLTTLDDAARAKIQFPFGGPQKTRWSNFPSGIFKREGLRLGDLSPTQRTAVMNLLTVALSQPGYRKVTEIMRGDEVLRQAEATNGARGGQPGARRGGGGPPPGGGVPAIGRGSMPGGGAPGFGEAEYYLAFLGSPSTTQPWMLQFGGHHLAINLTLDGSQASLTPSLPAAQPATYTVEGRTVRPLGAENDKAFALINSLGNAQRSQAILNYRVPDLVLGPGQDGRTIQPEGIRATALTTSQQTLLLDLVREWAGITADAYAAPRMADITANLPQTYFAWSGPTTTGGAAYFRIQGPTLVIEYAPQGSVDHIHTIYRDPTNDYGAKFANR
jgi:hypothetical protein